MFAKVNHSTEPRKSRAEELAEIINEGFLAQSFFEALLFFVTYHRFHHSDFADHGEKVSVHMEAMSKLIEFYHEKSKEYDLNLAKE